MRLLFGVFLAFALTALHAQGYPSKPLRLVLSYPPGGVTDLVARTLAQRMSDTLGQAVVVDNRPGGNFVIAAEHVAKSAPTVPGRRQHVHAQSSTLSRLPYDVERDLTPISMVGLQTPSPMDGMLVTALAFSPHDPDVMRIRRSSSPPRRSGSSTGAPTAAKPGPRSSAASARSAASPGLPDPEKAKAT
jgi:hypothetical protein